jgi:hypothetical protein
MFNQLSGINANIYHARERFEMAGLGTESALLSSAGIGEFNFNHDFFNVNRQIRT